MKVGKNFGTQMKEDVERVNFVRRLVGNKMRLAIDANQVWNCEQSLQFLDLAGGEDIAWFEEPVHSAAIDQIAQFCSSTPVAVAFGESERTSKTFPTLVSSGVRHLQPIPTQIGGVKEWMEVRDLASRSGTSFSSGGYSLFSASLMASAGDDCAVEYLYSIMQVLEQYFAVRPEWKNGCFKLPDIAGIGVRVDWDYCHRTGKIIHQQGWSNRNVKEYMPSVLL
jgi:L-alanine-DL-glutamate epimerase-like enolase superfamily enzyme